MRAGRFDIDIVPRYLSHYSGQSYHCLVIIKYLANVLLMHQFRLHHTLLNDIPMIFEIYIKVACFCVDKIEIFILSYVTQYRVA